MINKKQSLKDQKENFGQKGLLWLEPLRNWIEVVDSAGKLSSKSEVSEIKAILKRSGTNRLLRDKKIFGEFNYPFSEINKEKGLVGIGSIEGVKNKTGKPALKANFPVWWAHLGSNQAPTDYESVALTD